MAHAGRPSCGAGGKRVPKVRNGPGRRLALVEGLVEELEWVCEREPNALER